MKKKVLKFKSPSGFKNPVFLGLLNKIKTHQSVLAAVRRVLPAALAGHVAYALVIDGRLLLYADAPVWATQLRFYWQPLTHAAAVSGGPVERLRIRVLAQTAAIPTTKPRAPSLAAVAAIEQGSATITDKRLKATLQRLSLNLRRLAQA